MQLGHGGFLGLGAASIIPRRRGALRSPVTLCIVQPTTQIRPSRSWRKASNRRTFTWHTPVDPIRRVIGGQKGLRVEGLPHDELHTMAWDAATKAIEETLAAGRPVAFVHVYLPNTAGRATRIDPPIYPATESLVERLQRFYAAGIEFVTAVRASRNPSALTPNAPHVILGDPLLVVSAVQAIVAPHGSRERREAVALTFVDAAGPKCYSAWVRHDQQDRVQPLVFEEFETLEGTAPVAAFLAGLDEAMVFDDRLN